MKSLIDAFEHAFNFVFEGHKFTVRRKFDEEGEETDSLELEIDGILFTNHPFISSDFGKNITTSTLNLVKRDI